jgi:fucose 4-O-acetylase-like acetyltransferase
MSATLQPRDVAETGRTQPAAGRDPFWDNARWFAILLVVVGHTIEKQADSDVMAALYLAIYAFHMPLFAFLSGRFSSAGPGSRASYGKLVTNLVVPYLVFNVLWFLLRSVVQGDVRLDLAAPYQHLWFLVALLAWRLALPLVAALRYPLTTSVVVAVGAGYTASIGPVFDSGKILGMLPFFVLGWVVRDRGLPAWARGRRWATPQVKVLAAAVLLAAPLAAYTWIDHTRELRLRSWTQMTFNYAELGAPEWWAGGVRLVLVALALLLGASVLVLVPRGRNRITDWGSATMYVYMLHLFPIYLLRRETGFFEWFDSLPALALLVVAGIALTAVLSTTVVRQIFRPVVEPDVRWLLAAPGGTVRTTS